MAVTAISIGITDITAMPATVWINDGSGGLTRSATPLNIDLVDAGNNNGDLSWPNFAFSAWGDANGDGFPDLLLVNPGILLLMNDGSGNFTTREGAPAPHLQGPGLYVGPGQYTTAAWGDVDGDGDLDLFLGKLTDSPSIAGSSANELWINDGVGIFTQSTNGPANPSQSERHTTTVAFGDVDGDGDLDLFVGNARNYDSFPTDDARGTNELWINDGNGAFTLDSAYGSTDTTDTIIAVFADVDADGDLDLFVGNRPYGADGNGEGARHGNNTLWINDGNGDFAAAVYTTAVGAPSASTKYTTTAAFGDADGDGDLDLFVGNNGASETNELWLNTGNLGFMAASGPVTEGMAGATTASWADMDGDGDLDLFVGSGINELWTFARCASGARLEAGGCASCPTFTVSSPATGDERCIECPAHTSPDTFGRCSSCAPGRERLLGPGQCSGCAVGMEWQVGAECTACPLGEYADVEGTVSCITCPSFSTTSNVSATSISDCSCGRNFYSDPLLAGSFACSACPEGSGTSGAGATSVSACICQKDRYSNGFDALAFAGIPACSFCPEGATTSGAGATSVSECACQQGRYKSIADDGTNRCPICPVGATTSGAGAVSVSECICQQGRYQSIADDGTVTCPICPDGSTTKSDGAISIDQCECAGGGYNAQDGSGTCYSCAEIFGPSVNCSAGTMLSTMKLRKSFWRASATSVAVLPCQPAARCVGGNGWTASGTAAAGTNVSSSGSRRLQGLAFSSDSYCAEGATGPLCALCLADHRESEAGACVLCDASFELVDLVPLLVIVMCAPPSG